MTVWYDVFVFNKDFVKGSREGRTIMTLLETYLIGGAVVLGLMTLLEKTLETSKPGYKEYIASTSAFFPWFPRKRG
jgi:steroid 5-alpha reductase family enzyme